ncbi:hypothetical protein KDA14_00315 [Candidatus Saccharibacteria bacterium]|nr:hypothetical protein [Candidatus Saccharibacteria bacterium]
MPRRISQVDGVQAGWSYLEHRGDLYRPRTYTTLSDDRRQIAFDLVDRHIPVPHGELPGVSFYVFDGENPYSIFCGMRVPKILQSHGLGRAMLHWLIEEGNDNGFPLIHTVRIRKPLVALMLAQTGYEPDLSQGVAKAEILLDDSRKKVGVPALQWLERTIPDHVVAAASPQGSPFYRVVGPEHPQQPIEPADPSMVVHLHTRYTYPTRVA